MRIIEYTLGIAPFRRGGLPRYSTDLADELAKNNDVYVLYPGKSTLINSDDLQIIERSCTHKFRLFELVNPLPVSLGLGIHEARYFMSKRQVNKAILWIKQLKPDVIHMHTLMGLPIELLTEIKKLGIRVIYTTHDFYGLCPKMLSGDPIKELHSRDCSYDCMLCKDGPSNRKLFIMQSHTYEKFKDSTLVKKIRKGQKNSLNNISEQMEDLVSDKEATDRYTLRKYYQQMLLSIDRFHFNSLVSKNYIQKFFPNAKGNVLSITHSGLVDERSSRSNSSDDKLKIGYVGPYDRKKGFFQYIECLKALRNHHTNFEAYFYGDIATSEIFNESWVHNEGIHQEDEMRNIYKRMDLLVVPSLWHETFGFVVLEALLQGTPVLVSENVGAQDLLNKDDIFSDTDGLFNKLEDILNDGTSMKLESVKRLELHYKISDHAQKIINLFYK
ncbi:glycosyltransferase [Lactiplantibacillus sp. 30.2.29]|uniref:glycosyltransferase n=1 Tax=Lactiplantibacillus sp. 30.2.29 TaxID=2832297 RepID=UPI001C1FF88E|nr:glycosyltransferase [Lactiplantibacillus sp. 30.2.29]MBU7485281.1 glycosyltransferase [Lactiplantibacillus sp. 30.2.29]